MPIDNHISNVQSLLESMTNEDKQAYIRRLFTMCVEMANTSKLMRYVGDNNEIILLIENTAQHVLEHIYDDTYHLEQIMLKDKIINKDKIQQYFDFINE